MVQIHEMVPGIDNDKENMTDITKLKQNHMECIDAVVKVLMTSVKNWKETVAMMLNISKS